MIHISVVVSAHSRIIENTLLSMKDDFPTVEEALAFRAELEQWLVSRPGTGYSLKVVSDPVTEKAAHLFDILDSRDPTVFGPYYEDLEHRRSLIERRPYDVERLQ